MNLDLSFYKTYYSDLYHLNDVELLTHYKDFGMPEGRLTYPNQINDITEQPLFDITFYKTFYKDLAHLNDIELLNHYKDFGRIEGRLTFPKQIDDIIEQPLFDITFYKTFYKDLSHLNDIELLNHYKNSGMPEGRLTYPNQINDITEQPLFDITFYKTFYKDLAHLNDIELLNHYKDFGRIEGRLTFPKQIDDIIEQPLFDITFYKTFYKDLSHLNDIELLNHYKNSGRHDGRITYNIFNMIKPFILVIDFPNLGGGVTTFLNSIIEKYKCNTTIIVIRNINNHIFIDFNGKNILNKIFNSDECIDLLYKNQNKIKKILVNHTLGHPDEFINRILDFNKEKTYITHDFNMLYTIPQPMYNDIVNKTFLKSNINIHKFNNIITQNTNNLQFFKNYLNNNQNIIIQALPDYNESLHYFNTTNDKVIIGIIGAISDIKGSNIIKELNNHIQQNNLKMKIIVFGKINEDIEQYPYKTVNELNDLLVQHNPNVLLECSLWPETYSYTLTLKMLTQLPIISYRKSFSSVVENRLSNYNKTYYFTSIIDCIETINQVKQNWFYTINPNIYYNFFWDNYFKIKDMKLYHIDFKKVSRNIIKKNIVLVTSKIYVSDNPFSYTKNRSFYTSNERFLQTIETIDTIKKYIPNCYVVLFDNSYFIPNEKTKLEENVDCFINVTNNKKINYYTDDYEYKSFADISQQISFYDYFLKHINIDTIQHFFKISGRYLINESFDYNTYNNKYNIMKKNELVLDRDYYFTCFYKLSSSTLHSYFNSLKKKRADKEKYKHMDCEMIIPYVLGKNKKNVQNLGITQRIAIAGMDECNNKTI